MNNPACRAFIFDLDGTLLDTLDDLMNACNLVLGKYGHPPRSRQEFPFMIGEGLRRLLENASPSSSPAEIETMRAEMMDYYGAHLYDKTRPYAGMPELLRALAARSIPLAVFSNKPEALTLTLLSRFYADIPFRAAHGMREGFPAKPDPAVVFEIAARIGVDRAEMRQIGFVGDSKTDMQTARNAGCLPIGVTWGFRPPAELIEHGAELLLDSPAEFEAKVFAGVTGQ